MDKEVVTIVTYCHCESSQRRIKNARSKNLVPAGRAAIAAARVHKGAKVLTHCNSSAAVAAIVQAHKNGGVEAFCTETRPWRQGRITARELAAAGVPVTLVVDSAVGLLMPDINVVLVGADTIEWDGCLLNKVGTSQLACAAVGSARPVVEEILRSADRVIEETDGLRIVETVTEFR
mgnify:CR=1 FL=1